jgi:hypothetical protein
LLNEPARSLVSTTREPWKERATQDRRFSTVPALDRVSRRQRSNGDLGNEAAHTGMKVVGLAVFATEWRDEGVAQILIDDQYVALDVDALALGVEFGQG